MDISESQLQHLIEEAAEHASEEAARRVLQETFTAMGFDVSTPEKLIQVQVDMAYLRRSRRASEQVGGVVKKTAIAIVLTGGLSALWVGVQTALKTNGGG